MEPLDYLRIVLRRWPILVVVALIGLAVGYATAPKSSHTPSVRPKSYTATYVLALDPTSASAQGTGGVTSSTPNLVSMAFLATAGKVPVAAAKTLGFTGQPSSLVAQISTTPNTSTDTLEIAAVDADPVRAARIANAFATALMNYLTQLAQDTQTASFSRLQSALDANQAEIVKLDQEIAAPPKGAPPMEVLQAQRQAYSDRYAGLFDQYLNAENSPPASSPLVTFQTAVPVPTSYVSTRSKLPTGKPERAALGALLGLLLAAAAVIAVDLLDPRIRSRAALERAYALPVLAELPVVRQSRRGPPAVFRTPSSAAADAYRVLRASLLLGVRPEPVGAGAEVSVGHATSGRLAPRWEDRLSVLLVTAADERQGTSTVVANLAASLAEARRTVLVISADLRHPAVHRYLGAPSAPGLTDALSDGGPLALRAVARQTRVPGVSLVPSGTPLDNEIELLTQAGPMIASARDLADFVIIDAPPITAVSDASELLPFVDGVLVVCRASSARVMSARRALDIAARVGAPIVGVVLLRGGVRRASRRGSRSDGGHRRIRASEPVPVRNPPGGSAAEPVGDRPQLAGAAVSSAAATNGRSAAAHPDADLRAAEAFLDVDAGPEPSVETPGEGRHWHAPNGRGPVPVDVTDVPAASIDVRRDEP